MTATDQTHAPAPAVDDDVVDLALEDAPATADDQDAGPGIRSKVVDKATAVGAAFGNWWGFIARPISVAEGWHRSGDLIAANVPANSEIVAWLWWASNQADRIILFLLLMVAPTFLNGPILWCASHAARRWGVYLVVFVLTVVVPSITEG